MTLQPQHFARIRMNAVFLVTAMMFVPQVLVAQDATEQVTAVRVETLADDIEAGAGGIAMDAEGNVYSADFGSMLGRGGKGGDKVFRITPEGEVSVYCAGLRGASGNAFDSDGNLFQSNIGGNLVSKVASDGTVSEFSSEGLFNPVGIVIDPAGTLFVCNCGNGSIRKITRDGESTEFVKSKLFKCPNGITRDTDGNLYVANFYNGDVIKVSPDAETSVLATLPGNNNGHLTFHKGQLFVVARTANQIYRVSMDGKQVELFAGSGTRGKDDGDPQTATFSLPNDIVVSPDGKFMYVNEVGPVTGNKIVLAPKRVRRIVLSE